jgi:hypothetical protein
MRTAQLMPELTCPTPGAWPTTRILFALAGSVSLISAALAAIVSPWFLLLTALVGINQFVYVTVGACPASLVIDRVRRTTGTSVMLAPDHNEEI